MPVHHETITIQLPDEDDQLRNDVALELLLEEVQKMVEFMGEDELAELLEALFEEFADEPEIQALRKEYEEVKKMEREIDQLIGDLGIDLDWLDQ